MSERLDKLASWHKPTYDSFSDEDCIVCLTEKQIYLVGQALRQMIWKTRWLEGIPTNIHDVVGDLDYRLADRMTCEQLTQLVEQVSNFEQVIYELELAVIAIQSGQTTNVFDINTTTIDDVVSQSKLSEDLTGGTLVNCDSDDKDAIYGACAALVNFIHTNNVDFLEQIGQLENLGEQIERLIDLAPTSAFLPTDEVVAYAGWVVGELLDEYNATVDQALLDTVICELFCISVHNDRCGLDFADVLNYFADKSQANFSNATTTFIDLVTFATTGTFVSSMYFYFMCYFQIWIIYAGWRFLSYSSMDRFAIEVRRGMLSPSDAWTVLCVTCPEIFYLYEHSFSAGLTGKAGEVWAINDGTLENYGILGEAVGDVFSANVSLQIAPDFDVHAIEMHYERLGAGGNGTDDRWGFNFEKDGVSVATNGGGFDTEGEKNRCVIDMSQPTIADEAIVGATVQNQPSAEIRLYDVKVWLNSAHPWSALRINPDICP